MKKLFTKCKEPEEYKILLVEDGSIDVDSLEQFIDEHDLKIKSFYTEQVLFHLAFLMNRRASYGGGKR